MMSAVGKDEAETAFGVSCILIYTAFMNIARWTLGWTLMAAPNDDENGAIPLSEVNNSSSSSSNSEAVNERSSNTFFSNLSLKKLLEPPVVAALLSIVLASA